MAKDTENQAQADLEKAGKPPFMKDDDKDKDDEMKAEKKDMEKAGDADLTEENLVKSMNLLDGILKKSAQSRQDELLAKASSGQITSEERAELAKSLVGESKSELQEEISKSLSREDDEDFAKSVDATPFLEGMYNGVVESVGKLTETLEKSLAEKDQTDYVLAKAVYDVGQMELSNARLIKGLQERLDAWGRQPASAPKSRSAVEPLHKGFAGGEADDGMNLSKSMVLEGLNQLTKSAVDAKNADLGQQLAEAATKFEQWNIIDPTLLARVKSHLGRN